MNKPADLPTPIATAVTGRQTMTPSEAFVETLVAHPREHLGGSAGLGADEEVRHLGEDLPQPPAHDGVVVRDEDLDHRPAPVAPCLWPLVVPSSYLG